jgi:deoxyribodipyrimidine photo-lyase
MRELWATDWMHNRARLVAASFLVKHLLLPWRGGEEWFWDTLVDGDLANNTLSWQWVAGCGADAAPYFRIFNPVTQGCRRDPDGAYVRRWVPEIAGLPPAHVHAPTLAPADVRAAAGGHAGRDLPGADRRSRRGPLPRARRLRRREGRAALISPAGDGARRARGSLDSAAPISPA